MRWHMSTQEKLSPPRSTGETPSEIESLFERCVQKERERQAQSTKEKMRPAIQEIFAENAGPKFVYDLKGDALSLKNQYLQLVEELKTATDIMLWYRLGVWLKDEGIRNPETFFPESILKKLAKHFEISRGDIWNVNIVRLWLPYTEPLVRKAMWL